MKTLAQVKSGEVKVPIKCALVGAPGDGKTHFAATFPKCCFLVFCPGEIDTVLNKEELSKNLVGWEEFILSGEETSKQTVDRFEKFIDEAVRPGIAKGEIETVVIDNLTYLAELYWNKINEHDTNKYTSKQGNFDSLRAYGGLKDELMRVFLRKIITLPCNVIINNHLMVEDDEVLAKKPDKTVPYNAAILGGFRDKLPGMVSYVFYLEKKEGIVNGKPGYKYSIRTNKGMGKPARTRLELPPVIENVNYEVLNNLINEARNKQQEKGETK